MELGTCFVARGVLRIMLEYKVIKIISEMLNKQLIENKKKLLDMQKDKNCPVMNYEDTLDICKELEYAIKQMEKQI